MKLDQLNNVPEIGKLSSPWKLLTKTWQFYQNKFIAIAKLFVTFLPGILPYLAIEDFRDRLNIIDFFKSTDTLIIGVLWLLALLLFIYSYILFVVTLTFVLDHGEVDTIKNLKAKKKKFVWGFLLITVLITFFSVTGVLALIIPGVVVYVGLFFTDYIYLLENTKVVQAFKSSWNLIKGNWWRVFLGLVVTNILIGLVKISLIELESFLSKVSSGEYYFWSIFDLIYLAITVFYYTFGFVIYKELKELNGRS